MSIIIRIIRFIEPAMSNECKVSMNFAISSSHLAKEVCGM